MDRLGDLLDPALRRMGVRAGVRDAQLETALASLVGETLAPLCRAVELKRGTLLIATAHSALAHQLQLDSVHLVDALNAALGQPAIRRIRFAAMDHPPR